MANALQLFIVSFRIISYCLSTQKASLICAAHVTHVSIHVCNPWLRGTTRTSCFLYFCQDIYFPDISVEDFGHFSGSEGRLLLGKMSGWYIRELMIENAKYVST